MINKEDLACRRSFGKILYTESRRSIIDQLSEKENKIIGTQYKIQYFKENYNINEIEYYNICVFGDINYSPKCKSTICNNLVKFRCFSMGYYDYCCKKCSRREQIISPEQKEKFAHCNRGRKLTPEHIAKVIASRIGTHHSEEAKEHMRQARLKVGFIPWSDQKRESMKSFLESGGVFGKMYANPDKYDISKLCGKNQFKSGNFESKKSDKNYHYRSSYELRMMEILESDPIVVEFTMEPFSIQYIGIDNKKHKYIPDCLVEYTDNTFSLIEIKPERRITESINILKFKAAEKYCELNNMKFIIWTEKDLFIKNVVKEK